MIPVGYDSSIDISITYYCWKFGEGVVAFLEKQSFLKDSS